MRDEVIRTSETDPIQADFLPEDEVQTPGRLGMTFAPGMRTTGMRGRWERDLTADLQALEEEHETDVLVSLMKTTNTMATGSPSSWRGIGSGA